MTVIREILHIHHFPKPGSTSVSDSESLSLDNASDTGRESVDNEHIYRSPRVRVQRTTHINHTEDSHNEARKMKFYGKRKFQRNQNKCFLQNPHEDDEEYKDMLMEPYKNPFQRVLEDPAKMDYWQEFIASPEETQNELIYTDQNKNKKHIRQMSEEKPGRISNKIIKRFKIEKNLCLETIKTCEENLIAFFRENPRDNYIEYTPTSFDRFSIFGIAQFHNLLCVDDRAKTSVIVCIVDSWVPAKGLVCDFIKKLRKIE